MDNNLEQQTLAEKYLDEMLTAEKADDYEAWMQRFEQGNHNGPSKEGSDIKTIGLQNGEA